jgi:hypothetical protein
MMRCEDWHQAILMAQQLAAQAPDLTARPLAKTEANEFMQNFLKPLIPTQ